MKNLLDSSDRQFLDQLHRLEIGTVQEICGVMGVTATAVRQRLVRLQSLGLVRREVVRSGRGRPHHAYCVTDVGLQELGDNYSELALILWQEIQRIEDPALRAQFLQRIRASLVARYGQGVRGESLETRLGELRQSLLERGFDVEVDGAGQLPILRENNCPYHELASADPAICELEQAVFEEILGTAVSLKHCCLDGHHCCEFEVAVAVG